MTYINLEQFMKNAFLLIPILAVITGCTWVQLTDEGAGVRLAGAPNVSNCQRIGRATVQTMSEIVRVERGSGKLQTELLTLARNEAGRMGGDTIIPESIIQEGQQDFGVYRCP